MSRARDYKWLVLGCGSIGRRHIRNLLALGANRVVAFDPRNDRREEVRSQCAVQVFEYIEQVWQEHPQVAIIATPTSLHLPLALQAARRGCHLFIEKPVADSLAGLDQLFDEVRRSGLITLVGCNMRFHPGIAQTRRLIEEGAAGKVTSVLAQVGQYLPNWHPGEDYRQTYSARKSQGGGIVLDAIHEIDYVRWFLGEVKLVAAFCGKLSRIEVDVEDTAAILMRTHSGAIAEVHLDYVQRVYSRTCQVIGEEGSIFWDFRTEEVRWYSAVTDKWQVFPNPPGWRANQMYLDELRHFMACLEGRETPMLDVFEAAQVLEVALAAKRSSDTGASVPVKMSHS
ncbi:MAG TPA: Gfo/Idh/MocA family oxidoreductase [Candidatus Sulfotelmatobacter sp.]|nr:Gfo/Idh/MocA family oxidoreductase [Candidatus Sulfotelmatobacter sp.]